MSPLSFVTSNHSSIHPVDQLVLSRPLIQGARVLTPLTKEESDSVLSRTIIQGSPYLGYTLTPHHLKIAGMEPAYETNVDGRRVLFARSLIPLKGDRLAVIAYVGNQDAGGRDGETFSARSYYRSGSQGGSWRYLPGIRNLADNRTWFSKGYDENSLSVPVATFKAISELRVLGGVSRALPKAVGEFLFAGTSIEIGPRELIHPESAYNKSVEAQGRILQQDSRCFDVKPPHLVGIDLKQDYPNWESLIDSFQCESPLLSDGVPDQVVRRNPHDGNPPQATDVRFLDSTEGDRIVLPDGEEILFGASPRNGSKFPLVIINQTGEEIWNYEHASRIGEREALCVELTSSSGFVVSLSDTGKLVSIQRPDGTEYDFLHGVMEVRCFESRGSKRSPENSLRYLFHTDRRDRTMIGSILAVSSLNACGLYRTWAKSHSLLTPLYEYQRIDPPYADRDDVRSPYIGMWKNYLSEVPLLQDYTQRFVHPRSKADLAPIVSPNDNETRVIDTSSVVSPQKVLKKRRKIEDRVSLRVDKASYELSLKASEDGGVLLFLRSDSGRYSLTEAYLRNSGWLSLEKQSIVSPGKTSKQRAGVPCLSLNRQESEGTVTYTIYLNALPDRRVELDGVPVTSARKRLLLRLACEIEKMD